MILVGIDIVMTLNVRNQVVHHIIGELVGIHATIRHYYNHRHNLAFSQKVVHDETSPAHVWPCIVIVATTMNQVKYWQLLTTLLIASWCPNMETTGVVEGA